MIFTYYVSLIITHHSQLVSRDLLDRDRPILDKPSCSRLEKLPRQQARLGGSQQYLLGPANLLQQVSPALFVELGGHLVQKEDGPFAGDLSHPTQMLSYFSSIDEWEAVYPVQQQVQENAATPLPVIPVIPVAAQQSPQAAQPVSQPETAPDLEPEPLPDLPMVEVGAIVEISGEYACNGCGMQRTWLKGDCIEACDNVECLDSKAGWKLLCDLF